MALPLTKESVVRQAIVFDLASKIEKSSSATLDWQCKACRTCGVVRSVHLDFAAKTFRTLDQIWLPSDVEPNCIHCKASNIQRKQQEPCEMTRKCELFANWVVTAGVATSEQHQALSLQFEKQQGRCASCKEAIGNLRITNDPRRYLSIPQRVRYGVRLLQDEVIGVQESTTSPGTFHYYHLRCRQPDALWLDGRTSDNPVESAHAQQQERLTQLIEAAQVSYEAFLASERRHSHGDEVAIERQHGHLKRFYLLHTSATLTASRWNGWIRDDRNAMRRIKDKVDANKVVFDQYSNYDDNDETIEVDWTNEVDGADIDNRDGSNADVHLDAGEVHARDHITTDENSLLWRRLCQGARARSRRRGAGHLETLEPAEVYACWQRQNGNCAHCHATMAPETISVNRICTARMNNIYGQGNADLMHATCNMADAPNNLEEWLRGIVMEYSVEAQCLAVSATTSSEANEQIKAVPADLRLQVDEWRSKWQRKHNAMIRNAIRVQKTPDYARWQSEQTGISNMDNMQSVLGRAIKFAEALYDASDDINQNITVVFKDDLVSSTGGDAAAVGQQQTEMKQKEETPAGCDTLHTNHMKRRRHVNLFSAAK